MTSSTLALPSHFKSANADLWDYTPDMATLAPAAHDWANQLGLMPAASSSRRNHVLGIDLQGDFTNPQGTLYVGGRDGRGAMDDCARTAAFLYQNAHQITGITPTMDTHMAFMIFFPSFWHDRNGNEPAAHTIITAAEIKRGEYVVNPAMAQFSRTKGYMWLQEFAQHYCTQLEATGKYALYLWPYHCLLGTPGHALNGVVFEAMQFVAMARSFQLVPEIKGTNPLTECYSVLGPEVEVDQKGMAIDQKNTRFIDLLLAADTVTILGEASSHCVGSTIHDLLAQIKAKDPSLVSKVYLVKDCMSAVAVPDGKGGFSVDFTDDAEKALHLFEDEGMHVVESTTPMVDWPDFKAA